MPHVKKNEKKEFHGYVTSRNFMAFSRANCEMAIYPDLGQELVPLLHMQLRWLKLSFVAMILQRLPDCSELKGRENHVTLSTVFFIYPPA